MSERAPVPFEVRLQREIAVDLRQSLPPDRLLDRALRTLAALDGSSGRAAWYGPDPESGELGRTHQIGPGDLPALDRSTLEAGRAPPGHRLALAECAGERLGALLLVSDPDEAWDEGRQVALQSAALQLGLALQAARLQAELAGARATLRELELRDPLTGVWNRRGILERVRAEQSRASRRDGTWSVALAELDHLDRVQTACGHTATDALLRDLAARIGAALRPYDDVGRRGRGEFLVLLPHTDEAQAARVAERIRRAVEARPLDAGAERVTATLSLGVASAAAGEEVEALLGRADRALGTARAGQNQVVLAG